MSRWIWKLADNGWADWICPECGWRYNDDIHVTLDYNYCPNCGEYLGEDEKEEGSCGGDNFFQVLFHCISPPFAGSGLISFILPYFLLFAKFTFEKKCGTIS